MTTSQRQRQPLPISSVVVVALTIAGVLFSHICVSAICPRERASGKTNSLCRTTLTSTGLPVSYISLSSPSRSFRTRLFASPSPPESREDEIRKKIERLKEDGRLGKTQASSEASPEIIERTSAYDDYADKVQGKLGKRRGQVLGFVGDGSKKWDSKTSSNKQKKDYGVEEFIVEEQKADAAELLESKTRLDTTDQDDRGRQVAKSDERGRRVATIGSLPEELMPAKEQDNVLLSSDSEQEVKEQTININPALFDMPDNDEQEPPELSEEELIELVAERLAEKRAAEDAEIEAEKVARRESRLAKREETTTDGEQSISSDTKKSTTGVGGSWSKSGDEPEADYKPKVGGWGVFPRPKSISEAYGGGRRIGAGYDNVDANAEKVSTQRLLKDYRKKVGIEVPTEKEHAAEIDEALRIGERAMQRGVYATAVSALETVTQWCSTNSKVGSKVYLDLAMAYEAVGRKKEAAQIYNTLTECRMEDIKYNAKRLLYGMEAMEVMKSVSSEFSRKKGRNAFIDATGLDNFASNFDDVYQTAYVDLDNNYYKKLTESVVRSTREARQLLIQAQGKGEVSRTRIVQALRCISRQFDDLLQSEIDSSVVQEPTAYLNGKPIDKGPTEARYGAQIGSLGDFTLLSGNEMIQNIDGEWNLQLLADKSGDGVSFFNTTGAVQTFSIDDMTFSASGPSGLGTEKCSGRFMMDESKRVISKEEINKSSSGVGGILGMITGGKNSGFPAAISRKQQIVSVDSLLLITRCARGSQKSGGGDKEYFGVWRRVIPQDDGFP